MLTVFDQPKLMLDCSQEYVARVSLYRVTGPLTADRECISRKMAEADNLEDIKAWAASITRDCDGHIAVFSKLWPIPESEAPEGHRLHGKRDNREVSREDTTRPRFQASAQNF